MAVVALPGTADSLLLSSIYGICSDAMIVALRNWR
jgi:hypothetical protein